MITVERAKLINKWLDIHCCKCANNSDKENGFVNCQAKCEVEKDVGISCIHYEREEEEE